MAVLTSKARKRIPSSEFGLPEQHKYPMPDKEHARIAKAYASKEYNAGHLSKANEERIDRKAGRKLHGLKEHESEHWGN